MSIGKGEPAIGALGEAEEQGMFALGKAGKGSQPAVCSQALDKRWGTMILHENWSCWSSHGLVMRDVVLPRERIAQLSRRSCYMKHRYLSFLSGAIMNFRQGSIWTNRT